ncbi:Mov34/MPN/PAD-1 family protein [Rhizobium leucaenae]|uniref:Mov34/MPN/PAD-1 family protein n=1 Tax=Rhizobium leucaenae TaxID=29450 RepID=UPI00161C16D4|nr:Mov34/MPN/PAD-1 family protein [Rhizobium leucaenae]MBB6305598.1 proteasome lid subunit RPN8/RPN11 [Rhizobium leucaenae]
MSRIKVGRTVVASTIERLQAGGLVGHERAVLWLGSGADRIAELYEPRQRTRADQFYFDRLSMQMLLAHLREKRLRVLAQVHSHPGRAFHSEADDEWAIVRHAGALSLVLPRFAQEATVDNFLELAATYVLSTQNQWEEATGGTLLEIC